MKDFESKLKELEEIVLKLEAEALPLKEALALYKKGQSLTTKCEAHLVSAEKQIQILNSSLELETFEGADA